MIKQKKKITPTKNTLIIVFYFLFINFICSQNPWANPSYKLHDIIIYSGAGASTRHLEKNYLSGKYDYYLKSPFISLGFDYCFAKRDALWGVGLYFSGAIGKKAYSGTDGNVGKLWSNYMGAIKFTHHNWFFNRNKIDVCSGYIIGARSKHYERIYINNDRSHNSSKRTFQIAAGISLTAKYYPTDLWSIYAEGTIGYNVDIFQIGIARRIKNIQ